MLQLWQKLSLKIVLITAICVANTGAGEAQQNRDQVLEKAANQLFEYFKNLPAEVYSSDKKRSCVTKIETNLVGKQIVSLNSTLLCNAQEQLRKEHIYSFSQVQSARLKTGGPSISCEITCLHNSGCYKVKLTFDGKDERFSELDGFQFALDMQGACNALHILTELPGK